MRTSLLHVSQHSSLQLEVARSGGAWRRAEALIRRPPLSAIIRQPTLRIISALGHKAVAARGPPFPGYGLPNPCRCGCVAKRHHRWQAMCIKCSMLLTSSIRFTALEAPSQKPISSCTRSAGAPDLTQIVLANKDMASPLLSRNLCAFLS
ncbi:hypothetical protein DAEQUDRAFT_52580 [Daedalea quercina L-15889]|uniref:Uncharacterized protein n=1 Tax=Daedalea quercina L-15889 TaxID=1314783 RepID=A0A165L9K1_9APHY|nr:hypothetical protein DAEQUDRAFT_52580 [Daedalea quercina L-15889]